jgi:hypothetical protein
MSFNRSRRGFLGALIAAMTGLLATGKGRANLSFVTTPSVGPKVLLPRPPCTGCVTFTFDARSRLVSVWEGPPKTRAPPPRENGMFSNG